MAGSWGSTILKSVSRSGGVLAAAVLSLFLVPILTFYLLRDWDRITAYIAALIPRSQRDTVLQLARDTDEVLGAFTSKGCVLEERLNETEWCALAITTPGKVQ